MKLRLVNVFTFFFAGALAAAFFFGAAFFLATAFFSFFRFSHDYATISSLVFLEIRTLEPSSSFLYPTRVACPPCTTITLET